MSKLKSPSKISNLREKLEVHKYSPSEIEKKWQEIWEKSAIYSPNLDSSKKPFYNLMMFPYPSASGMHVGNMYAFTGADVYGRFMRMRGFDVFEPTGLDGFGIHSENYAIKIGRHPKEQAKISEKNFYRQLRATGNGFDWSRKVETYDPKYYKWTQWLFIQLFKAGLAYRKKAAVNFCPSCKTVLADEQVINTKLEVANGNIDNEAGSENRSNFPPQSPASNIPPRTSVSVCERCGTEVYKKDLEQWFFRITKYAEKLLKNIEKLDWSEKVKIAQRQWIGKSEGARISFPVILRERSDREDPIGISRSARNDNQHKIEVFTTRVDTLYGATFLVLSPEHPIVASLLKSNIKNQISKMNEIKEYVDSARKKTEQERLAEGKEKTGVFTGHYTINPINQEKIPIWIADYALMGYGTGALFGDAHDERDVKFAKKYRIPLKVTVITGDKKKDQRIKNFEECFTGYGTLIDSGEFSGLTSEEAKKKITAWLKEHKSGGSEITYHLRDWLISRQRYWGPPIPMIYCEVCAKKGNSGFTLTKKFSTKEDYLVNLKANSLDGWPDTLEGNISKQNKNVNDWNSAGWFPVQEKDLPVLLPDVKDWKPKGSGKSPLASVESFVNTTCPNCKGPAKRETDVSDTFLDSAWYFFRYTSTDIDSSAFDIERLKKWLPVKMYIGGAEHSVLHLLYSRFIWKVLCDLGYIDFSGEARPRSAWEEPFSRFFAHGLLIKEGAKMSKSKGNVVVPDGYIKKFGADTLRMYLMFLGPFSQGGDFYDTALEGMHRFVKRVWRLIADSCHPELVSGSNTAGLEMPKLFEPEPQSRRHVRHDMERVRIMHKTIKKVTEDIEQLHYNTAIASLMMYYNFLSKQRFISKEEIGTLLKLLAPFTPHMTEQLFQLLRSQKSKIKSQKFDSIHLQPWPSYDPKFLVEDEVTIVVQVNGKIRDTLKVQSAKCKVQSSVEELARKSERVSKYLQEEEVKRVVYVEGKVINFVTD